MKKFYMPLAVLSLGSLWLLLASERGRSTVKRVAKSIPDFFEDAPESLSGWSDTAEREIASIQQAIDSLAKALAATEMKARA